MPNTVAGFPVLLQQWDVVKNAGESPENIAAGSNRKFWWLCSLNHSWQAVVANRTRHSSGCPFCANQKLLTGFNDLEFKRPDIAREWHPQLNGELRPSDVLAGSKKLAWWLCSQGHAYETTILRRTSRGTGCRFCSGNSVLVGFNDLETKFSEISREWHPELNQPLTPRDVSFGSPKKRWWRCPDNGHAYEMGVSSRTGPQRGKCPYCSNQRLLTGFNDLATTEPELAKQWDRERNYPLTPEKVSRGSKLAVWWKCPNGAHPSFLAQPSKRAVACGICLGQTLMTGFNDVDTRSPELAEQWHPVKNGELTPQNAMAGGRQKVWWLCEEGHDWEAAIYMRKRNGCPYCGFKKLWPGFNDLLSVAPDMAAEWHPTKNGTLTPRDLMSSVPKVVWWECPKGHAYQASPNSRSSIGPKGRRGCNICANKVVIEGINHLSTTHPELWNELVKDSLTKKRLETIFAGTVEKLRWRCERGHEWDAVVFSRGRVGTGCPDCAEYGFKPEKPAIVYFLRNDDLRARKIGITNTHTKYDRVGDFVRNQGWEEIGKWSMLGRYARAVESKAFFWIRGELGLGQYLSKGDLGRIGGETETFSMEGPEDSEIVRRLEWIIQETVPKASQR